MAKNKIQFQKKFEFRSISFRVWNRTTMLRRSFFTCGGHKDILAMNAVIVIPVTLKKRKVYQCNRCHTQRSLISNTIFASTKVPLTIQFLAIYFITQSKDGLSSLKLTSTLGTAAKSALRIKHKLQQTMKERDDRLPLKGMVLIDDAYCGGKKRDGKRGRGAFGKTPFVGV